MKKEDLLKECIEKKYNSIHDFSIESGIPETKLDKTLNNDLMIAPISDVILICQHLNIDLEALVEGEIKEKNCCS